MYGFDVDQIDVRMHELNSVVDKFVVLEGVFSGTGMKKALVWSKIKNTPRFSKFVNKNIHIIVDDDIMMKYQLKKLNDKPNNHNKFSFYNY